MKRFNLNFLQTALFLLCISATSSCQKTKEVPLEVGTLTAYYAKEKIKQEFSEFEKGELYLDSNNTEIRVISDDDNFIFETDAESYYSYYNGVVPKSKIDKKTYKMHHLSIQEIGSRAVFVSDKGCTAKIFWSNGNGHKYCSWDGKETNWGETNRYYECYVLSVELISPQSGEKYLFEEQLDESQGYLKIYHKPLIGQLDGSIKQQEMLIGSLADSWVNERGWDDKKSAYSSDGNLLTNQWECDGIPEELSIAYLAEEKALYINGDLYYRK